MTTEAINQVNIKLKKLPDALLLEVEKYIDFLSFKYLKDDIEVHQWQQDLVLDRIDHPKKTVDAFEMLDDLEKTS